MTRRKKKKNEFAQFMKVTILIVFLLSALGMTINPATFVGVFIFVCVVALLFVFLSTPFMKGKIGEWYVSLVLKALSKKHDCKVINDVIIISEGKSSQIDHILINKSGVYVIETKNYSGRIYGRGFDKQWTQVLAYGKVKKKLYSPLFQNKVHIYRLKEILGIDENIFSLVVFVKGNIGYIESDEVYTPMLMYKHICEHIEDIKLSDEDIDNIYNKIIEFKTNPMMTVKEHVEEIKETRRDIAENICPHCKTPLILRTSRYGTQFYGCSNYPNCKFTKKIDV